MKKAVCVLLTLLILCGCTAVQPKENKKAEHKTVKGVWISYSEINAMLEDDFKTAFLSAAEELKAMGISDLFVHVRAFGDSLFKSDFYPLNPRTEKYNFDVLKYMTDVCKDKGLFFHAWINPYRTTDGTFLDPADSGVKANIINGIREIITKYKVDGIHFDDYFYPSADAEFDRQSYENYCNSASNPLSLSEFRTANINSLISSVYTLIKFTDKDILFSVSPSASVEKNKNEFFADVCAWCESGCVDIIIPQLYFGFEYPKEEYAFLNLLNEWKGIKRADGVRLAIGLAVYKIGTGSEPDREEWQSGADIINRQTEVCLNDGDLSGVCFFSLTSLLENKEKINGF